ncbi:hypothetical protein RFI_20444, partial [Reticulomyxa filosa]
MCAILFGFFNAIVKDPYMDEVFHISQTQEYCKGNWKYYDPKITTFPGLYFLPAIVYNIVTTVIPGLSKVITCSPKYVRMFNLLYIPFFLELVRGLGHSLHGVSLSRIAQEVLELKPMANSEMEWKRALSKILLPAATKAPIIVDRLIRDEVLELLLFPFHFLFFYLFYTDVPSLCWILCTYYLTRNTPIEKPTNIRKCLIFCTGFIAVLHRQTNV